MQGILCLMYVVVEERIPEMSEGERSHSVTIFSRWDLFAKCFRMLR